MVAEHAAHGGRRRLVILFLLCLALPFSVYLGSARLSPARAMMLLAVVPLLVMLVSSRLGRISGVDRAVLLYAAWVGLSLLAVHGAARVQYAGISVVEILGPYLLARAAIRTAGDMRAFACALLWLLAALLPAAIVEALTDRPPIIDFLAALPVHDVIHKDPRLGLYRVQAVFEHPILYGVVASSAFSLAVLVAAPTAGAARRGLLGLVPALSTFLSLSMGAFLELMLQLALLVWNRLFRALRARWRLLAALALGGYLTLDMLSNRTPFHLVVDYLTFNSGNAYNRILIWQNGVDDVLRNPVFGIGLNEWTRPAWMSGSMDNFWLVQAVRHGLPGAVFIMLAVALTFWRLGRVRGLAPLAAVCRTAHLITLAGLCLALCTVHVWNNSFLLFMFMLGAGHWIGATGAPTCRPRQRLHVRPNIA